MCPGPLVRTGPAVLALIVGRTFSYGIKPQTLYFALSRVLSSEAAGFRRGTALFRWLTASTVSLAVSRTPTDEASGSGRRFKKAPDLQGTR